MTVAVLLGTFVAVVADINRRAAETDGSYNADFKPTSVASNGDWELAADSGNTALYMNYSNGKFFLEDKQSGKRWYSTPQSIESDTISKGLKRQEIQSEIILDYIYCLDENSNSVLNSANSKTACQSGDALGIEKIKNGVKVTYDFKNLEIRVPVTYTLENGAFCATVLTNEIEDGTKAYLVNLSLLPYFGAAGAGEDGYMLVPDGSGAIVSFNNGIILSSDYDKPVYGNDPVAEAVGAVSYEENILMPVFGTVHSGGNALMGVITEGDGAASLAVLNGNANNYWNTVYSKMRYRVYTQGTSLYKNNHTNTVSTVTHNSFDSDEYTVSYYFLSGDEADYSGMAKKYRAYLTEKYGLTAKSSTPALAVDIYGALTEKTTTFGVTHNTSRVLTDFETAEEIVKALKADGADNLCIRYIGWSNNGVYNEKIATKASPLKVLGGKKAFASLNDYLNEVGVEFYPVADIVTFTKSGGGASIKGDSAKATNGSANKISEYSPVTLLPIDDCDPWVLLKPSLLTEYAEKLVKSCKKLDISSVSFAEVGENIWSDFTKSGGTYRTRSVKYTEEMLKTAADSLSGIAVSGGNAYAAALADRVFELPIASSGYEIFEYDIPFAQLVLHGLVDYTTPYFKQSADMRTVFLKAVETGSDLLFACVGDDSYKVGKTRLQKLYSSEFSLWREEAVEYYSELCALSKQTGGAEITGHECVEEDLFKVSYSNGTVLYVNYSAAEKTADGVTVAAKGYTVGRS